MSSAAVPLVYARTTAVARLEWPYRLIAAGIAACCLGLLGTAAWLTPSPSGYGTHTRLGLTSCQFLQRTGIPCPGCGMTTSFSWFVRGNLAASFYVQPMGMTLALIAAITFWGALYIALSGKPAHRLVHLIPPRYYLWYLPALAVAAWGWKIFIHLDGIDGWQRPQSNTELVHNLDAHP